MVDVTGRTEEAGLFVGRLLVVLADGVESVEDGSVIRSTLKSGVTAP